MNNIRKILGSLNPIQWLRNIFSKPEDPVLENPVIVSSMTVTKTPRVKHRNKDAVRWALPTIGLKPSITANWLVEKGYLEKIQYSAGNTSRQLTVPTTQGESYFQCLPNLALVITAQGWDLIEDLHTTGQIPTDCYIIKE